MKNILVAHDGSKLSDNALKAAVEIAVKFNSSLTVISIIPELYLTELSDFDRQKVMDALSAETTAALERIRKSLSGKPIETKTIMRQGPPAEKIIETAQKMKVDLIVTGSHGRHGARKFLLGSVSSRIVDYAPCPVLVIK